MKKPVSQKAREAWMRNLEKWENVQALSHKLSDNKEMITIGFIIGFSLCLIAAFVALGL